MNPYDLAQQLIARLGKLLGVQALALEGGTHSCALEFDGHLVVTFEFHEASGQLALTSLLATLPDPAQHQGPGGSLVQALMAANFVDYLNSGSFFGLEPQSRQIALMQSRSVTELDDAIFERLVETFVNKAELAKRQIEQVLNGAAPEGLLIPQPQGHAMSTGTPGGGTPAVGRPMDGAHIYG